jgi:GntR family transcriptional regulator / MocR family aminotransferase
VRQHRHSAGLDEPAVPVDSQGARIDELVTSGAVLDGERRRQLTAWADGSGLVIEDDYADTNWQLPPSNEA